MPADICFHISSAEAVRNGHGDATKLTLPIQPALHIPADATPTASLRSLCFTNTLANATASDSTSKGTIGLFDGTGAPRWTNGSAAPDLWTGLVYNDTSDTAQTVVYPLVDLGGVWSYAGAATSATEYEGYSVAQMLHLAQMTQKSTWANSKWLKDTGQITDATAQYAPHLPGSSGSGVLKLETGDVSASAVLRVTNGTFQVDLNYTSTDMASAITSQHARIATTAEVQAKLAAIGHSSYTTAVELYHTYLGVTNSATTPVVTMTGGDVTMNEQGTSTPGWEQAPVSDLTFTIPDGAYTLEQIEQAVSRAVLADATFKAAIEKELTPVKLADPDGNGTWADLGTYEFTKTGADGAADQKYRKIVGFEAALYINRCRMTPASHTRVESGALFLTLLGFDTTDLGAQTVTQLTITASNAARIDKDRSVVVHCPTLAGGSYSTKGERGGSALAMVPVTVGIGEVESWEAKVPINVPCGIAGTALSSLTVYLLNEDSLPVNFLGDRWEAIICLSH